MENPSKTELISQLTTARANGERADLRGVDLSGVDLSWVDLRKADLSGANLRKADLHKADLSGADLSGANLSWANLRWADLRGVDLSGANLSWADLRKADLSGANLRKADLSWADLSWATKNAQVLHLQGLPSGEVTLHPTPAGWYLYVGCWSGALADFEELISQDEDWPEAEGAEVARRRPSLEAVAALCKAHMDLHPHVVEKLAEKWAPKETPVKTRVDKAANVANRSTLQMAAALALLVVGAMAVVYAILTAAPTGADVGPSEAALRCREDSLALVEGATTSAALAGGDGIIRGTLSGPGFEAEWACTYLEGPDGWLITSGLTEYRRK